MQFVALSLIAIALVLPASPPAMAQSHGSHGSMGAAQTASKIDGEVRKVDKAAGKLTIKHGEIKAMGMPPMTMMFVARDKALLDKVKVGDKVRFSLASEGGNMVVTEIEPAR